jgi:hypothetical protein
MPLTITLVPIAGKMQHTAWRKGEMNYTYALENMGTAKVGKQYAKLYSNLTNQQ